MLEGLVVIIGDAAGSGVPASLLKDVLQPGARQLALDGGPPAEVVDHLRQLVRSEDT